MNDGVSGHNVLHGPTMHAVKGVMVITKKSKMARAVSLDHKCQPVHPIWSILGRKKNRQYMLDSDVNGRLLNLIDLALLAQRALSRAV